MYVVGTCILWNNKDCCFIFRSLGVTASSNLQFCFIDQSEITADEGMSCSGVNLRDIAVKIFMANNRPVWRNCHSVELQLPIPQQVSKWNLAKLRQCFVSTNRHFFNICPLLAAQIDIAMDTTIVCKLFYFICTSTADLISYYNKSSCFIIMSHSDYVQTIYSSFIQQFVE